MQMEIIDNLAKSPDCHNVISTIGRNLNRHNGCQVKEKDLPLLTDPANSEILKQQHVLFFSLLQWNTLSLKFRHIA